LGLGTRLLSIYRTSLLSIYRTRLSTLYRSYTPQYWVVISLELLERGAYYGIMGYFPVHLMRNLSFTGLQYGVLYALLMLLLYLVPLFSASIAKRIGYRKMLIIAFIILIPAYLSLTFLRSYLSFFPLIVAWGLGAGAFKPMVSATIAHVTEKEHRNSAYSIYYLSINWGSLLAMLTIGLLVPEHFAQIAFAIGAILITANLIITFIFYKDPVEIDPTEKLTKVFSNILMVLPDLKFVVLLLIYSGFFFIFSSMHTFLPVYYTQFGMKPWPWLEAPIISAINPFTIVSLGPILSRFSDKFDSLKLMIYGISVFCIGLFILGMIPVWYMLAIGIFVFSIGEFLTHPNFISYVSRIAPHEKVALYMGFAFIPSAIGNFGGSIIGGALWDRLAVGMESPSLFWGIYVGIGLFTIGNFLIYNRIISSRTLANNAIQSRSIFTSRLAPVGAYLLVALAVFAGFSGGTKDYIGNVESDGPQNIIYEEVVQRFTFSDTVLEGTNNQHDVIIIHTNIQFFNATLIWIDEPDQGGARGFSNNPDRIGLSLIMENITEPVQVEGMNPSGATGNIQISHRFDDASDHLAGMGTYNLIVQMEQGDAGDQESRFGFFVIEDVGNEYSLSVEYQYLRPVDV